MDDSTASRIADILQRDVDWQAFLLEAIDHRVLPLTWRTLSQHFAGAVPPAIANEASQSCAAIVRRNLFLTAKLGEIVGKLSSDGIRVLAYKGPTSAIQSYGSLSLRQFGDLDLLVDKAEYPRARELLEAYGYCLVSDWGWECSLDDASQTVRVDLHRNVTPNSFPVRLDFDRLWERREYAHVLNRQIPTLCAEDALVILSIQLAKDSWGEGQLRLSKVCDIAELIRSQRDLNWGLVESTSRELGCRRMLDVGLGVTARLLGPMPASVPIDRTVSVGRARLEGHTIAKLFEARGSTSIGLMPSNQFRFGIRERFREKLYPYVLNFSMRLKPNERDFALLRLPASLRYLYYLLRPIRLARDGLCRLFDRRK
jgi:hypothetical protein